jgi:hypothetical protein
VVARVWARARADRRTAGSNGTPPTPPVPDDGAAVSGGAPVVSSAELGVSRPGLLPRVAARAADRALFEVERGLRPPWVGEQVIAIGRTHRVTRASLPAPPERVSPGARRVSAPRARGERRLVVLETDSTAVWDYTILALERNLARAGVARLDARRLGADSLLARGSAKLGLLRNYVRLPPLVFFKVLMTPAATRLFPTELLFETVLYCMDCFSPSYEKWERMFRRVRPRVLFLSSRRAAAHFGDRLADTETVWLPEATDPTEYRPDVPLVRRRIDVLELGRRHDGYHSRITPALAAAGKAHRYEQVKGQVVFPAKEEFVEGIGQSKVSVCFPCSMTHPARSGDDETTTHRYFESIASGSVLVGHCPAELRDLFGYDPVVSVDWNDPSRQILEIVDRIDDYQPQVERNYQRLLEVGTWEARTRTMLALLRERGIG